MKIAIDYDDTYTADTEAFSIIVEVLKRAGHEVRFVTYRPDDGFNDDIEDHAKQCGIDIIYTAGMQKANCYNADIWIDDSPEAIPTAIMLQNMYSGCVVNNDMGEL